MWWNMGLYLTNGFACLILQALGCVGDAWLLVVSAKRTFFFVVVSQFESSSSIERIHDLIGHDAGSNMIGLLSARNLACYVLFDQLMISVNGEFLETYSATLSSFDLAIWMLLCCYEFMIMIVFCTPEKCASSFLDKKTAQFKLIKLEMALKKI